MSWGKVCEEYINCGEFMVIHKKDKYQTPTNTPWSQTRMHRQAIYTEKVFFLLYTIYVYNKLNYKVYI